jgi:PAS domain S-box-containing protein
MRITGSATRYLLAIATVVCALYLRFALRPLLGIENPYHTLWLAVVFCAWYCGIGPSILSVFLSALGVWYLFLPPLYSFSVPSRSQAFGLLSFLFFSSAIIALGESNRRSFGDRSRLGAIVESSDDAIISKNLDGTITSWNKSAERMFGHKAHEALGRHITMIIPPDRRHEETKILERLRRGERIDHFETVRMRKDGTMLDISITVSPIKDRAGIVVGASKVARDIGERKKAERDLRESEERFRTIVDTTPECVTVVSPNGTLLYMNSSGLKMIGADQAETIVGKDVYAWIAPEDRDAVRDFNERTCRGERGSLEFDIIPLNGGRRHMETHAAPLLNNDGTVVQLAVTRDVTERKLVEEAIRESELSARLMQLQDNERRRMARELHDGVGQLLAAMSMNASLLNQEITKLSANAARCAEENQSLTEQVSSEIRTISYLLHPPLLDEMGLHSALQWYVEGFAERSKIAAKLELPPESERLSQDIELSLFRIAQECLTNIHRHSKASTALVRLVRTPEQTTLEITDDGQGIDVKIQSKLATGGGGGVGLRGMRERLRQLGGTLEVRSNGKGTKVIAIIPTTLYAALDGAGARVMDGIPQ